LLELRRSRFAPCSHTPGLNRRLGTLTFTAQAVATVGLTLTAVINIPATTTTAGHATWVCYAIAVVAILLVHRNDGAHAELAALRSVTPPHRSA
jgi:hypothetical protein